MTRSRMRWQCPHCGERNTNAHQKALYELALLTDNMITNKNARTFLQVSSPEIVKKILQKSPLVRVGKTKGAYYKHSDLAPFL